MGDFQFIQNPTSKKWIILAQRRSKRPDVANGAEPACPFCIGREKDEPELFRIGGNPGDSNWRVRVIPNKFPFAPHHELVIHSPDHHNGFIEYPLSHVIDILKTYRQRYNANKTYGQVYIFHNRGMPAGESMPHSHTQIAAVPNDVQIDIPKLDSASLDLSP